MADWLAPDPVLHFTDSNGNLLSGGKLFTYAAGTTTKLATYTDSTGATANTNPIILNSRGECNCWIPSGTGYKFVLSPATDTDPPTNAFWTVDQVFVQPALPTPGSNNEDYIVTVNAGGTAYQVISPAALLSLIGAAPASGGNYASVSAYEGILNSNTSLSAANTGDVYGVGAGSTAPFTITLPAPSANLRFLLIGMGGSYVASISAASGSIILPDGSTPSLPYAGNFQDSGVATEFFANGTNWIMSRSSGINYSVPAFVGDMAPRSDQTLGGITGSTAAAVQNVAGSRAFGTTYTNSLNKPIYVYIGWTGTIGTACNLQLSINGVIMGNDSRPGVSGEQSTGLMSFVVPPGATYVVSGSAVTLAYWNEYK